MPEGYDVAKWDSKNLRSSWGQAEITFFRFFKKWQTL